MQYNHKVIERKWQKIWKVKKIYEVDDKAEGRKNFYHLVMFPYPSGDLHMGHWYNFAPADVYARLKRMQGYNVLSPIGFDAFGLPAENAAIKNNIHPEKWTLKNIKTMTAQLMTTGNSYDWSRVIITCAPDYYKWNQWLFLKLYEKGLAYRKKAPANWCPSCKTVLANEQVIDGKCERCGSIAVQREIDQWLFKITDYAEQLLNDLDGLDWPERAKTMQKNWIGRSVGVIIKFQVVGLDMGIEVFTTRPDTVFGATYLVLAPEHELIQKLKARVRNWRPVLKYLETTKSKTEKERIDEGRAKTGIELTGLRVINPATKNEIPVWTSDYVIGSYGVGAIMAVPSHDERDREFAATFKLPVSEEPLRDPEEAITAVNGKRVVKYKLRDWLISRQRYWGTPIPIIYCKHCGTVPVPEESLPVKLPPLRDFKPADDGRSPLARDKNFMEAKCPKCGGEAERETDTMDTFVDSSWYFFRFLDPKNKKAMFDALIAAKWLPVNTYIGGVEHATKHLIYARFITKFLQNIGLSSVSEPFTKLVNQGLILGPDGQKMSKSRGNIVNPDELVKEFGADAVRMHLCFMGEYSQGGPWDPKGILGVSRFLNRVLALKNKIGGEKEEGIANENDATQKILHKTIRKIEEDLENIKFNTAISALMILLNELERQKKITIETFEIFLLLLAPFAPHLSEELWQSVLKDRKTAGRGFASIHFEPWPKYNKKLLKDDTFELVVQVNGRVRDSIIIPTDYQRDKVEEAALNSESVKKYLGNNKPERLIYIPQKLINIVIAEEKKENGAGRAF
ncbi:MAG: leucine--tRNA ligase [Candidatus Liptonbacteria bacterium]|nr:leucine--tRNA ligase [Candidatus Liptonbacteria bacterium]